MMTLAATAERLRMVKAAEKRFLALWASECISIQGKPLEDVAAANAILRARPAGGPGWSGRNLFPEHDLDDLGN